MFTLDTKAASNVNGGGNRINESGIYKGRITRAEWNTSNSSQAGFLSIDFKSDEGREAKFMSICYQKGDGTRAFGYDTMMAIMAVTQNRQITTANLNGKNVCPELMDKQITLALQAEGDWYQDDQTGEYKPTTNMVIYVPFNYQTGQTAKELLSKSDANVINNLVVNDRKGKDKPNQVHANQSQSTGNQQVGFAPQMNNDYDDSIPF